MEKNSIRIKDEDIDLLTKQIQRKERQNKLKHLDYSIDSLSRRITLYVVRITRYFVILI